MCNACAARISGLYACLGILVMSLSEFVTSLRSEPMQIRDMIRIPELHCRKYPLTKDLMIIKIRSTPSPSIMPTMSQNSGFIMLEKYSSHQKDHVKACFSPSTSHEKRRRKVKCPELDRNSESLRPFEPCKLSSCPLCKREHPRTSTRLKLPFHLFSP